MLKNIARGHQARRKQVRKRSLHVVNEHPKGTSFGRILKLFPTTHHALAVVFYTLLGSDSAFELPSTGINLDLVANFTEGGHRQFHAGIDLGRFHDFA